jgi:hypothetical protein
MIVKGRVIPRPSVDTVVVESSQRPGVGRASQNPRSVRWWAGGSGVASSPSARRSLVSAIGSTVPRRTDTFERVFGRSGWRGPAGSATRHLTGARGSPGAAWTEGTEAAGPASINPGARHPPSG